MSAFTPAGSGGAAIDIVIEGASSPTIINLNMPTPGTEYLYTIPDNAKQFLVVPRNLDTFRISYTVGGTTTLYLTVPRGDHYGETSLSLSAPLPIYLRSSSVAQVAEILIWT